MKKILVVLIALAAMGYFFLFNDKVDYEDNGIPIVSIKLNKVKLEDINTGDKETEYKNNNVKVYDNGKKKFSSKVTIKGRGNHSWTLPKKPYQLSFDREKSILGLPKAKKFVFLANYTDSSLMRNNFIYNISKNMGLNSKTGKYCDLYVDDEYIGNYYVIPKVEISSSSMNLKDKNAVLIELDNKYYKEEKYHFTSSLYGDHLVLKDYNGKDYKTGFNAFKNKYNEMEKYINEKDFNKLSKVINIKEFIDYYLLIEYSTNMDGLRSSFYMYMDGLDDKIHVGQIWDFDIGFGDIPLGKNNDQMPIRNNTFSNDNKYSELLYKMLQIPEFDGLVKTTWNSEVSNVFKKEIDNLDNMYKYIEKSGTLNNKTWELNYYDRSFNFFKRWVVDRYKYFDDFFK